MDWHIRYGRTPVGKADGSIDAVTTHEHESLDHDASTRKYSTNVFQATDAEKGKDLSQEDGSVDMIGIGNSMLRQGKGQYFDMCTDE